MIPDESRGPSSTSLAPSTVTAPVCRSHRKYTVDLAGTDTHVLLFPYGTDSFHLDIPKDIRVVKKAKSVTAMEYYSW